VSTHCSRTHYREKNKRLFPRIKVCENGPGVTAQLEGKKKGGNAGRCLVVKGEKMTHFQVQVQKKGETVLRRKKVPVREEKNTKHFGSMKGKKNGATPLLVAQRNAARGVGE